MALDKERQVSAFKTKADERGTPFVEVDRAVCDYVNVHGDRCVREMFSRHVKGDGTVTALFPFQTLRHSFFIFDWYGRKFDPVTERQSNENVRLMIEEMKERIMSFVDPARPDAVSKAEHYVAALDTQLNVCRKTDELLNIPVSFHKPRTQ